MPDNITQLRVGRPAAPLPQDVPKVTRGSIEAALKAHHGRLPDYDQTAMSTIELANSAMALIDKRRSADGSLSPADQHEFNMHAARVLPSLRAMGLYVTAPTAPKAA